MRYSNRLRRYRRARNLTQRQVAALMGLRDGSLISRWEHGFSLPDLENAFKLSVIYGVMVDALFIDLRRSVQGLGMVSGCGRVKA
jgi:transcriptional regulator with XRE-family HTH domain